MPITFKCEKQKPFTIERDGTVFYFDLDEGVTKRVHLNATISRENDYGALIVSLFRFALIGWDNLLDEKGNEIAFSVGIRDALILKNDEIFVEKDIFNFMDHFLPAGAAPDNTETTTENQDGDTSTESVSGATDKQEN